MLQNLQRHNGAAENAVPEVDVSRLALNETSTKNAFWPDLRQIECAHDISHSTLWSFMDFEGRPSFNPKLLGDFHSWQSKIKLLKLDHPATLDYVVLGSRHSGVFCLGGDLEYFMDCISRRDRNGLAAYGLSCIEILHQNWSSLNCGVTTIGLAQGDALGGGFEALLSFDIICAEKGAKFGFPEQLFGLFPGMGALSFLGRKLGFAKAEWLVRSGQTLTAEQLYDLGLVHILADHGQGIAAVTKFIRKNGSRSGAQHQMHRASKRANPIPFDELSDIVWLWVDACLQLDDHNLQIMRRLAGAQAKLGSAA